MSFIWKLNYRRSNVSQHFHLISASTQRKSKFTPLFH